MGDTFEKRRREQKKRQKKKEKDSRKVDRAVEKARGDSPGFVVVELEDIVGDLGRSDEARGIASDDSAVGGSAEVDADRRAEADSGPIADPGAATE